MNLGGVSTLLQLLCSLSAQSLASSAVLSSETAAEREWCLSPQSCGTKCTERRTVGRITLQTTGFPKSTFLELLSRPK